jgi:uncharacterized membrane protein YfcA
MKEYTYRMNIGYPYNTHDIKWDSSFFIKFPIYALLSGVMAGLLGIGGGLILGPLLLELGLHPVVSTATSNFLVLFTSSSTSIQFIILGMMNLDYGLVCTIASTIGSFIGTIVIQRIIKRTKKNSYLIFALTIVLGISTIVIPAHTFLKMVDDISKGKSIWSFNTPC